MTAVTLYNETEGTNTTTFMDPQTEYAVKIEVKDLNTLNDLTKIEVVIFSHGYSGVDSVVDQATYEWTPTGWIMVGPGGTWSIDETDCKVPGDLTAISGTWWLHFTPGKVATEALWNITATPTDNVGDGTEKTQAGLSMLWYGELTADDTSFVM